MILNLTQHAPTPEQVSAGVVDLPAESRSRLLELLTFRGLPTPSLVELRAQQIAVHALTEPGCTQAMIGGAPYLMCPLEHALRGAGIQPVYAYSERVSVETVAADGTVRKSAEFRHLGFYRPLGA
jgi:hypothetical protein